MSKSLLSDPLEVPPDALASGTYLTDETNLYRVLGPVDGSTALVTIEDCHSLDVILIETDRVGALRRVMPSAH